MMGINPSLSLDSPPTLLIAGGLFFIANYDTRGWILILMGVILALELSKRCQNIPPPSFN